MSRELPPPRPEERQALWVLRRHEAELRGRLERIRAGLAEPALARVVEGLPHPDRVHHRFSVLTEAVEEALRALGTLQAELTDPAQDPDKASEESPGGRARPPHEGNPSLPAGLAAAVDRFLRRRARTGEFQYTLEHDAVRGWSVRWREVGSDGAVHASGRLYERPWTFMSPPPGSGSTPRP